MLWRRPPRLPGKTPGTANGAGASVRTPACDRAVAGGGADQQTLLGCRPAVIAAQVLGFSSGASMALPRTRFGGPRRARRRLFGDLIRLPGRPPRNGYRSRVHACTWRMIGRRGDAVQRVARFQGAVHQQFVCRHKRDKSLQCSASRRSLRQQSDVWPWLRELAHSARPIYGFERRLAASRRHRRPLSRLNDYGRRHV